ncbi:hypothetical protein [Chitinilyticum piscinae]|uniref:Tetratricopeptide repeat protein n=1 Tax=Chitinilyticum piscinae TaxID=2866724 RepID=A0A8J7K331_9NEIS|nr:hypothetical protein [Chitinilyticum piscinae]MBE9610822.1 hypothetical protein [Chitinilyticum piscinae]
MSPLMQLMPSSQLQGHVLCLPELAVALPDTLQATWLQVGAETLITLHQELDKVQGQPDWILGDESTPALPWLLAIARFPDAGRAFSQFGGWCVLKGRGGTSSESGDTVPLSAPPATPVVPLIECGITADSSRCAPTEAVSEPAIAIALETNQQPYLAAMPAKDALVEMQENSDKQLLFELFKHTAWEDTTDNRAQCERIEQQLLKRAICMPSLASEITQMRKKGEKARALADELLQRWNKHGDTPEFRAWFDAAKNSEGKWVSKHLDITLNKLQKFLQKQAVRHKASAGSYTSHLPSVVLVEGHHPNSLRYLQPAAQWDILIDETGQHFDQKADDLPYSDKDLGRIVALAIPQGIKLPPLKKGFHAADESAQEVDDAVACLMSARVGLFGFTANDAGSQGIHWINHVRQVVRWVLMQLPFRSDCQNVIQCHIENRGQYKNGMRLDALEEIISSELHDLDPERFQRLILRLNIIGKEGHPYNGYVDAVAFTWGSPAAVSRDRLKKSLLQGHCLLRPDQAAMERLYLAISRQATLSASDWYALCGALDEENSSGLIHSYLHELGQRTRKSPHQWRHYLDAVQTSLRLKQYRLTTLAHALQWLDDWRPEGEQFSGPLQLEFAAARLALANHRGRIEPELVSRCIELARELRDEMAPQCCETLLRVATLSTNYFDFDLLRTELEDWRQQPIATVGKLNRAKLCSALGQLYAFKGELDTALTEFDQALTTFASLSDPIQAQREAGQTSVYRLIVLMDGPLGDTELEAELTRHFRDVTRKANLPDAARSLAASGHEQRFDQHLLLRACITRPALMHAVITDYLATQDKWERDIDDHPWPLINAYRAWLLVNSGKAALASEFINQAIDACTADEAGLTLRWMGLVLHRLAERLKLEGVNATGVSLTSLIQELPNVPQAGLTLAEPLALLRATLPFNFH